MIVQKKKEERHNDTHDSNSTTLVELQLARHGLVRQQAQLGQTQRHSHPSGPRGGRALGQESLQVQGATCGEQG